jgi:acetylornithine deacetylase/succinyl-diaminopimelate desuccinylase-like protein
VRRARIPIRCRIPQGDRAELIAQRIQQEAFLATGNVRGVTLQVAVEEEKQRLYTGRIMRVRKVTPAWRIDPFSALMERSRRALSAAGMQANSGTWHLDRLGMGTAGGVLVQEFGIPTVGFGPGHEDQAHAVDEFVSVENIGAAVYGTATICHALIGVPVVGWTSNEF